MRFQKQELLPMRRLTLSFITMGLLLLNLSCGNVTITDKEFCVDQGTLGAHCAHTMTTPTRDIPQPIWDNMRFGQFCTVDPQDNLGSTFAQMKKEIEELCSYCNCCDYPAAQSLLATISKISEIQKQIGQKKSIEREKR